VVLVKEAALNNQKIMVSQVKLDLEAAVRKAQLSSYRHIVKASRYVTRTGF
jgi:hypothetical protein